MRFVMKLVCWAVFLVFIGLSSFANWEHGHTFHAKFMLAVVPVGFAATVFILEAISSNGRATRLTYAGVMFVATAAGVASYIGLYGMAIDNQIGRAQALLMPLAFDGVVAVASMGIRAFTAEPIGKKTDQPAADQLKQSAPKKVKSTTGSQPAPSTTPELQEHPALALTAPPPASPLVSTPKRRTRPDAPKVGRSGNPQRGLAVKRVMVGGETAAAVAKSLGLSTRSVQIWVKEERDSLNPDSSNEGSPDAGPMNESSLNVTSPGLAIASPATAATDAPFPKESGR